MFQSLLKSGVFRACLAAAVLLVFVLPAHAQLTSLYGRVHDPAGAVVTGVTVTLTSATGAERTDVTDSLGVYRFLQVQPGKYRIKAERQGFKSAVYENLDLLVDTPTTLDLKLDIGGISETVTVEANAVRLNTQDATLGTAFEATQVIQLPLESRNVANLLSLQAAVTPTGYVSGARSDQSNLTLDGIDVNEQQTGEAFASVLRVNPDSLQEFRVTTSTINANQGRSSGGQVSLVTKSGTNEWHGSLYEYHRNTATTANDFFNNRIGEPREKLIRNVFGGSVGGPILKDRFFFFYNYEGRRDAAENSILQKVPTATLGQGIIRYKNSEGGISQLSGEAFNALFPVGMNPAALELLAEAARKYPANDTGTGDGLNVSGFRFNAPLPVKYNGHTLRLDFNLTQDGRHRLFARGNYQHDTEAGEPQWPDTPGTNKWSHPIGYMVQHDWTVSSSLINTLRYGVTRQAFSQQGDSNQNAIQFRFVFEPYEYSRTLSRTTPVYNIVDDVSWRKGNHTFGFGTNIRIIRNERVSYANSYDAAYVNPSYYEGSGAVLTDPIIDAAGNLSDLRAAVAAVIGRYSQYSGSFNFDRDGSILSVGEGVGRTFATEEYEFYAQDSWRVVPSLTLTYGLRWGLNRPVYESTGFQVKPTTSLGDYFEKRKASAARGVPYNETISVDLAGPANGKPGYYDFKKNDFSPRVGVAWQPTFNNGVLKTIFGEGQKSVIRGGFSMSYDRIGSALAVSFDLNNTLGFSSTQTTPANLYNVSDRPGPLYTGLNQGIRNLPGITIPGNLTFPLTTPADEGQRIEQSLDDTLTSPVNYSWNFSIAREFGKGLTVEASYVGRRARNLLATRDIMQLNNIVDPQSGMDWYTAAGMLYDARKQNVPVSQIPAIPYFENLFPYFTWLGWDTPTQNAYGFVARDGFDYPDYTYLMSYMDDSGVYPNMFFHPQYAALSVWSTVAYSDYHAATLSVRERLGNSFNLDFNYTFSKSIDNASGLQTSTAFDTAFILNSLRPDDNKAVSDFDMTHIVNVNSLWQLPVGRGRRFLGGATPVVDAFLGGWQLGNIFRWNSGTPVSAPFDGEVWATNWNVMSSGSLIRPLKASPTKSGDYPNFFKNPEAAFHSFRNAKAGETGQRNVFRIPSYVALDFQLAKSWNLPYAEGHKLQLRWEVFNLTNTQRLAGPNQTRGAWSLGFDPDDPATDMSEEFGRIVEIQGSPRVMQFALRYDF
ncbi:MAG: carboxypeptidase-like regulatory domain-containing protein [Acidobacteriota bacterium]|nr:carboxypeptidase-like regulatory domain-containing protein [Acidobacteriota bacterium]